MASYLQMTAAYYNRKVQPRAFKVGTLVLKKVFENIAEKKVEKLYIVSKVGETRPYHFQKLDETPLLHSWNVFNLKQYYQ